MNLVAKFPFLPSKFSRLSARLGEQKSEPRAPNGAVRSVQSYTPRAIVAGSRLYGSGKPLEVAYHAVASALETNAVKFVHTQRDGYVHFIGAAARDFTNAPDGELTTELALGLPGVLDNEAVGLRTNADIGFSAIRRDAAGTLSVYSGSDEDTWQFISTGRIEIVDPRTAPKDLNALPRWVGFDQTQTTETKRAAMVVVLTMFFWSMAMTAAWIGGSYLAGTYGKQMESNRASAEQAIREAASALALSGRRNETVLEEFQKLAAMAISAQGKVTRFTASEGKVIGWRVEVPEYTPSRMYERFAVDKAEVTGGKLVLSKGKVQ